MAILKIEVDTEDLRIDEDGYGQDFADLFNSNLKHEISKRVISNITKEEVGQYSILVQEHVQEGVLSLFKDLLNEDVSISDGYGRKKFVGSVEDYIKKEIDDKYLHSVDSQGKRLNGCSTTENTWVQWYLEKEAKSHMDYVIKHAQQTIENKIDAQVGLMLNDFVDNKIKEKATAKLIAMGLKL